MTDTLRAAADAAAAAYLREYDRADLWHRVAAAVLAVVDPDGLRASFDQRLADVQDEYRKAGELWDRQRDGLRAEVERLREGPEPRIDVLGLVQQRDAAVREAAALRAELAAFHEHHVLDEQVRAREAALRAGVEALHVRTEVPESEHFYCDEDECDRGGEGGMVPICGHCRDEWPCATVALLAEHPTPEAGR